MAVASRSRAPGMLEVTRRYRLPFDRAVAPIEGSSRTTVSSESSERSSSGTKPSFIWSRTAMAASCRIGRGVIPDRSGTDRISRDRTLSDPEAAGRVSGLYASDPDAKVARSNTPGCCAEGRQELGAPQSKLLGDDRLVGFHEDSAAADFEKATAARRRRDPLGHECRPDRRGARETELRLQAQRASSFGQQ